MGLEGASASRASYMAVFMKWEPGLRELTSFLGLENCIMLSLRLVSGPSTMAVVLLVVVEEMVPQRVTTEHLGVPNNYHGVLGPGQGHVETPGVGQEADALVLVAPDAGDDDDVLLTALEGVYAGDLDVAVDLGV